MGRAGGRGPRSSFVFALARSRGRPAYQMGPPTGRSHKGRPQKMTATPLAGAPHSGPSGAERGAPRPGLGPSTRSAGLGKWGASRALAVLGQIKECQLRFVSCRPPSVGARARASASLALAARDWRRSGARLGARLPPPQPPQPPRPPQPPPPSPPAHASHPLL